MRVALIIIITIVFGLLSCPEAFCDEGKAREPKRSEAMASLVKIASGKTFQDQNSENVSFTLSPMRASIKISF